MKKNMTASEAVEGSIKKWRDIRDGKGKDYGGSNCSLCEKYNEVGNACGDCLIKKAVGARRCDKTPYSEWRDHLWDIHGLETNGSGIQSDCKECIEIVEGEIEFLKTLRPLAVEIDVKERPIFSSNQILSVDDLVIGEKYQRWHKKGDYKGSEFVLLSNPIQERTGLWVEVTGSVFNKKNSLADMGVVPYESGAWNSDNYIERASLEDKEKIASLQALVEDQRRAIKALEEGYAKKKALVKTIQGLTEKEA